MKSDDCILKAVENIKLELPKLCGVCYNFGLAFFVSGDAGLVNDYK